MNGLLLIEPLYWKTVKGLKTQTRRTSSRYHEGEILYLKEPYILNLIRSNAAWGSITHVECTYLYDGQVRRIPIDQVPEEFRSKLHKYKMIGKPVSKLLLPEYLARHYVKITSVRTERLKDISKADAIAEGLDKYNAPGFSESFEFSVYKDYHTDKYMHVDPVKSFRSLFEVANAEAAHMWDDGSEVTVYTYELVKPKSKTIHLTI